MTELSHLSLRARPMSGAYRAVWRWHFYAGILVLPLLCLMALTGGLYLFKDEIDRAVYSSISQVEARGSTISPDRWLEATESGTGAIVSSVRLPARSDEAVRLTMALPDGGKRTAFVDPYNGQLLGITEFGGVMETVKQLHSLSLVGSWANYFVEIVAGWTIILVATGVYLWWPRKRDAGVMTIKGTDIKRRPFWRDLHAVTGLYAGAVIAFLAVTGMPWSAFWGAQYANVVRESGIGRPSTPPAASPWSHTAHKDKPVGVGWTMENAVLESHHGHGENHQGAASLLTVVTVADREGLARPYVVSIPSDPNLAFTVARENRRVEDARALYIDGTTGLVKADIRYDQFGIGAKAFEWGIAVHQGTQYGRFNQFLMLGGCLAVWLLAISGVVMWWKRRPKGRLGAPVAPPEPRLRVAVLCIVVPLALLFPLTGLSLLAAVTIDFCSRRIIKRSQPFDISLS